MVEEPETVTEHNRSSLLTFFIFLSTEHLQDAIETGCVKCTETQEKGAYTVIEHLIQNELDIWREITAKFDPEGKYRKKYEDRAKAKGIKIPE